MINLTNLDLDNIPENCRVPTKLNFSYGTAGFREKAEVLDSVIFRIGMLAALRSRYHKGESVGVMITASHNPPSDNGVKLVEPNGNMLDPNWEKWAVKIVNCNDVQLRSVMVEIVTTENISDMYSAIVVCGMDTRESSPRLRDACHQGVIFALAGFYSFEYVTTPQFHFWVKQFNLQTKIIARHPEIPRVDLNTYFERITSGFMQVIQTKCEANNNNERVVYVDAANGVGAKHTITLNKMLESLEAPLRIEVVNIGPHRLNTQCGADFVKIEQKFPHIGKEGKEAIIDVIQGQRWSSLDGDADRIVYFFVDKDRVFHLLDGDKIATLFASFIGENMKLAGLTDVNMGIVQTAYANGNSTAYIKENLGVPIYCVKTGVKHLHHKAEELDVGVYFEANGHGTVIFSDKFRNMVKQKMHDNKSEDHAALTRLMGFMDIINETVGDALSDLLGVEAILYLKDWHMADWNNSYVDLPNRQLKVNVRDRNVIETFDAERKCSKPKGLQNDIDAILAKDSSGKARAFVRPSGTENVVRVYAESTTQNDADALANSIAKVVEKYCS